MNRRALMLIAAALLAACATDPNVIQYGGIVCERVPASADVPRRCWPANSLADDLRREERVGKEKGQAK